MAEGYAFHKGIITAAVAGGYSFALCRFPKSPSVHCYISFDRPQQGAVLPASGPAFVCSPFNHGDAAFIFNASLHYEDERIAYSVKSDSRLAGFLHQSSRIVNAALCYPTTRENIYASKQEYEALVRGSVDEITAGKLIKVVAARCERRKLKPGFDPLKYFYQLCDAYSNAFICFFSSAETGTWMGATPEKLVSVDGEWLQTVALAGTLAKNETREWEKKERDEHRHVEQFIEQVFSGNGISGYRKGNVQTVAAGNLRHLSSTFTWRTTPAQIREEFPAFLRELNPTPAVCGLPLHESLAFLTANEHFERRFYSGFVGVATRNALQLYVNLRCMELMKDAAILYAGAGITADSVPGKEWEETQDKMETLGVLL